ncbi:hypothetical protein J6590_095841 [Homalodisca vitripennis]|nr:hypothetical protein J6590_095841 [Homalodisca vitripennis]
MEKLRAWQSGTLKPLTQEKCSLCGKDWNLSSSSGGGGINTYKKEQKEEKKGKKKVQTYPKAAWSPDASSEHIIHEYEYHNHTSHRHRLQWDTNKVDVGSFIGLAEREQKELWEVYYNKKRLPKTPNNKQCSPKVSATVAHHSGEPRKKRRGNNKQRISLPFSSIIIEGDSHTRGLTGILRRMVTCETMVGGVCKPGAKLMEATSDDSPPAGGCYVIVAGTNDVASGQQYNIYRHLERRITSKLRTSRVVVSTLPHRHDLPASHQINQETVLINNYIEELCERHRGAEVLQFNNIGRGAFYTTWDASKEEHEASAGPGINRVPAENGLYRFSRDVPTTRHSQRNQALKSPTAPLSTALQPPAASEPRTLLYESFAEAVKCRSPVRQVGPSSTITDTTEQKNCFPLKCQKTK